MPAPELGAGEADPLGLVVAVASFLDAEPEPEADPVAEASLAETPALTAASGVAEPEAPRREGPVGVAEAPPATPGAGAPVASAPMPQPMREEPAVSVLGGGVVSPLGEAI